MTDNIIINKPPMVICQIKASDTIRNMMLIEMSNDLNKPSDIEKFIDKYKGDDNKSVLMEGDKKLSDMLILSSFRVQNIDRFALAKIIKVFMAEVNPSGLEIASDYISNQSINVIMFFKETEKNGKYNISLYVPDEEISKYNNLICGFNSFVE